MLNGIAKRVGSAHESMIEHARPWQQEDEMNLGEEVRELQVEPVQWPQPVTVPKPVEEPVTTED